MKQKSELAVGLKMSLVREAVSVTRVVIEKLVPGVAPLPVPPHRNLCLTKQTLGRSRHERQLEE